MFTLDFTSEETGDSEGKSIYKTKTFCHKRKPTESAKICEKDAGILLFSFRCYELIDILLFFYLFAGGAIY